VKHKTLFQTLKDKNNIEFVKENGPFECKWENTWLGDGYYFWDTFVENAHWWGKTRHKDGYIICRAYCDYDNETCFDLVGDTDHLIEFDECVKLLKELNLFNEKTKVARVVEFLKSIPDIKYQAIRVYGVNSISNHKKEYEEYRSRMTFEDGKAQYLDYKPAIQMCLFKKNSLNLRNLEIEYPEECKSGYAV